MFVFQNCVFLTDLGEKIGQEPGKVYVSTNGGKAWVDLVTFANVSVVNTRILVQVFFLIFFTEVDIYFSQFDVVVKL